MSMIREALRRWPPAVRVYLACKAAFPSFFPAPTPPSGALNNDIGTPSDRSAPLQEPAIVAGSGESLTPENSVDLEPAPSQEAPAPEPAYRAEDFDIYHQYPPHIFYTDRAKDALFRDAVVAYSNVPVADEASGLHTDPNRVVNFFQAVQSTSSLEEADYLELGSHRGFSLRVIHKFMDPSRALYALDTFEGFDERDISVERSIYETEWTAGSFAPTSVESVASYVGDGAWPANLKLVRGWFPDAFADLASHRWRFVHIDFDLYQPIKTALETVWPNMVAGGVVMVHDYGCYGFPAARMAVDEFCAAEGVYPVELNDRWSTAILRKPARRL